MRRKGAITTFQGCRFWPMFSASVLSSFLFLAQCSTGGPRKIKPSLERRTVMMLSILASVTCANLVVASHEGQCHTTTGKGYNGLDLVVNGTTKGVPASSVAECCSICWELESRSPGCRYFTFSAPAQMCTKLPRSVCRERPN